MILLQADHFMMNKYSGPRDRSFQSVSADCAGYASMPRLSSDPRHDVFDYAKHIITDRSRMYPFAVVVSR
ncbi:hypothetical protein ACJ41O_001236 [Fusarium nematophilum]